MPPRPSGLPRAIECPASVWQVDDGMPQDPNKHQAVCDRGTVIHEWWYSLTTPTPLPPPCPPKHQAIWLSEAERMDPGGQAEVHLALWEYRGQPLVTLEHRTDPDEGSYDGEEPSRDPNPATLETTPPRPGATLVFHGTADRLGKGQGDRKPWVEDLKTGRRPVSPRSWQLQAYGLMWWVYLGRPASGVTTSILDWFRDLSRGGQARRRATHLSVGTLVSAWQTFLALRARIARREPPRPNPECSLCPVAGSCPALNGGGS